MRLLVVTQAVDTEDPVLGFFVRWIEELAKRVERVEVICLREGRHDSLPANVRVHSLGKENGVSRVAYVFHFYRYISSLLYDAVFVHMNEEYVLLGGLFWRLGWTKVVLWRNHKKGSWKTRLSAALSDVVLYTSPQSYTATFPNAIRMPVGIDTDFFTPDQPLARHPRSILFAGRIAPVKHVVEFIEALHTLRTLGVDFSATVAGASLPYDKPYEDTVRASVARYNLEDRVRFVGAVSQEGMRALYREHEIYVNLTPPGSMDKTIFEAMACGTTPLVANRDLEDVLGVRRIASSLDPHTLAMNMRDLFDSSHQDDLRGFVVREHSLAKLSDQLMGILI
ncbi:MAG: glycosyltransferase family 4 protein [Candidatus Pacebacteria bacterium]|nr:glycosyltransferase family 4 protein [Candidatus Paceibacterota bacterium]